MGMDVYSADAMFEEWKSWRIFDKDTVLNDSKFYFSFPPKHIKCRYVNPKWIPLGHDFASNYIGIDLDPDTEGKVGQVINFGRDENQKMVLAESLVEFFKLLVKKQKEMIIMKSQKEVLYINRENIHPNDWLKKCK